MANLLKLAFDRQTPDTLATLPGFSTAVPLFYQFDVKDLAVQVADPAQVGLTSGPTYNPVDCAGTTLRVTMSDQPKGNAAATILAGPAVLNWVPAGAGNAAIVGNTAGYFSGSLDLTLAALANFIAGSASGQPWIEFAIRENNITKPLYVGQVTVKAVPDQGQAANPQNPQLYMTLQEAKALFLAKAPTAADSKTWLSPDLSKAAILTFGNDGIPHWDILPAAPAPAY